MLGARKGYGIQTIGIVNFSREKRRVAMHRTQCSTPNFDDLPDAGYARLSQLIPTPVPFSSATLWRKVKAGQFPAPRKLSEGVTAWNVGAVRAWLAAQAAK